MNYIQISKIVIIVVTLLLISHLWYQTESYQETYQNMLSYKLYEQGSDKPLLEEIYNDPERNPYENPTIYDLSNYNVRMSGTPKKTINV